MKVCQSFDPKRFVATDLGVLLSQTLGEFSGEFCATVPYLQIETLPQFHQRDALPVQRRDLADVHRACASGNGEGVRGDGKNRSRRRLRGKLCQFEFGDGQALVPNAQFRQAERIGVLPEIQSTNQRRNLFRGLRPINDTRGRRTLVTAKITPFRQILRDADRLLRR